jgi:hypothetical protein
METDEMRNKASIADYLYFLAVKYGIDFDVLFRGLIQAREKEEAWIGKLGIQCRQKARTHEVFLITDGHKVVAQFVVPKHFLEHPCPTQELKLVHLFRQVSKPNDHKIPKRIDDLRCGMKRITLRARVLEIPKATLVFTRFGEYARVTNALIADETGTVKLCLWNEKINTVSIGSVVQIENATVSKFRGETQLRLGKGGRLEIIESRSFPSLSEIEKSFPKRDLGPKVPLAPVH